MTTLSTTILTLSALAASVRADGDIDPDEVIQLRDSVYADGEVDSDEIVTLFELGENCTYGDEYVQLVTDAVRDYAYADDNEIDVNEAAVIRNAIESDGVISPLEVSVLNSILSSGASMPDNFRTWATNAVS